MKPGRLQIIGAALSAVLAVQCLYQNSLLLLAICAAGIVVCARSRQWKRALQVSAIGGVSALSLAPYYEALRTAQDWGVVNQAPLSWQGIWRVLASALAAAGGYMAWVWLGLCALSLVAAGWCCARRGSRPVSESQADLVLFSGTILVIATVTFLLFLKWARLLSQPWYYLPLMAVWAVSIDAILAALARRSAGSDLSGCIGDRDSGTEHPLWLVGNSGSANQRGSGCVQAGRIRQSRRPDRGESLVLRRRFPDDTTGARRRG